MCFKKLPLVCLLAASFIAGGCASQGGSNQPPANLPSGNADAIPEGPGLFSGEDGAFGLLSWGKDSKGGNTAVTAENSKGAPVIWNSWQDTNLPLEQCVARAQSALKTANFTQGLTATDKSAYALNGNYRGVIRCAPTKQLVFFVVAGPTAETAASLMRALRSHF